MKTSEIKKFLQIYYKRVKTELEKTQKRELTLLWKAIKAKIKKDRIQREQQGESKPKAIKKVKKLEYDTEEWEKE